MAPGWEKAGAASPLDGLYAAQQAPPRDLNALDWLAAEQRRKPSRAPVDLGERDTDDGGARYEAAAAGVAPRSEPSRRRQRWIKLTRCYAVLKMASFSYSSWWLIGMAKANLGTTVCCYGMACFMVGAGGRWRRRWFGPGQLLEPELYEGIGTWAFRIGSVVVLAGGALWLVEAASGHH